jgi:hypothetical protein
MRGLNLSIIACAVLYGCQTADNRLTAGSAPTSISASAASAIAGDMAGRFAEQIGEARTTTIQMDNGSSDFAVALKAALNGYGYTVVAEEAGHEQRAPIMLAYAIDSMDGQVLARVSTSSIAIGRAYSANDAGASPISPLSILRRN